MTGVERPVPRWSSSSTRKSFSARSSQAGAARVAGRPRRLEARPALQVDQERLLAPLRLGDLAREDVICSPVRVGVVERDLQLVVGQHEPGHGVDSNATPGSRRRRAFQRSRASSGGKWPDSSNHSHLARARRAPRSPRAPRGSAPPSAAAGTRPRPASPGRRRASRASPSPTASRRRRRCPARRASTGSAASASRSTIPAQLQYLGESALRMPRVPGATPGQCSEVAVSPG